MSLKKKFCALALLIAILVIPMASVIGSQSAVVYTAGAVLDDNDLRDAGTIGGGLVGIGAAVGLFCGVQTAVLLGYAL